MKSKRFKYVTPKPKFIHVDYVDPMDGQLLCSSMIHYDIRLSADGFYTAGCRRVIAGLRSLCADTLNGRNPRALVEIIY